MTSIPTDGLVISGLAVTSPYGIGEAAFTEGLAAGRRAVAPLDGGTWPGDRPVPYGEAGLIPGFDIPGLLGRKGTRSMDRLTGIAVVTTGLLLERYGAGAAADPEGTGLVLGVPGSLQSCMSFTEDAVTGEKPYYVEPSRFPNTVLNHPTGRCAIRHDLRGPNASVSGGAGTGLLALNYASRLLRAGHADALLCGAAEEFTVQRARLTRAVTGEEGGPLGEGAAVFLLESAAHAREGGRVPLAAVLGSRFRSFGSVERAGRALEACVSAVLEDTGTDARDLAAVAPSGAHGALGAQETAALDAVLGASPPRTELRPLLGDTTTASTALQLAALVAPALRRPADAGRPALVTFVDRDGTAGCTLVRPLVEELAHG
ncbi:beta-ketoacyl synthase N-terminal-like domain-containing protein [Streptomyces blastmyceticus]|uniref:Beta-ketoacyl synthase N-terminal-like domain-containing protein n=1 Tax=Streptomyces blastmyceticus TaxID=68180 RepID=A0ABP3G9R4_9ACTN